MKNILVNIFLVSFLILGFINFSYAQNWTLLYNGMYNGNYGVDCLAKNSSFLFASVALDVPPYINYIYSSSDKGENWFVLEDPGYHVRCLLVNNTSIFAGVLDNGIWYSSNNGVNWAPRGFNAQYNTPFSLEISGPNLIMGISKLGGEVYYTSNNGLIWTQANGITHLPFSLLTVNNTVFAGTGSWGVYASTDNGVNWSLRSDTLHYTVIWNFHYFNNTLFAATGNGIYKSTNGGYNWASSSIGLPTGNSTNCIASNGSRLFAGTDFGPYVSTNSGISWTPILNIIGSKIISDLEIVDSVLFASSNYVGNGVFSSTNNGQSWKKSGFGFFNITNSILSGNTILVSTDSSGIYSSTNEGATWYPASVNIKTKNILSLSKNNSFVFAGTGDSGVYKSSNNGGYWAKINNGLNNLTIKTLYTKDSVVFAGTNSGIFKTTNNGNNWTYFGLTTVPINAIYFVNNTFYAGTNTGLQISTDNGVNWSASILTNLNIKCFYTYHNNLYIGTNAGVYYSTDNGYSWIENGIATFSVKTFTQFGDTLTAGTNNGVWVSLHDSLGASYWKNLGPSTYESNTVFVLNGKIFASFMTGVSSRIYSRSATTVGILNNSNVIPEQFLLFQNYPNPFNPVTKIKFSIPPLSSFRSFLNPASNNNIQVTLKVFDILGREVTTLVNEQLQPGTYEVIFDGSNLKSGIYFYFLSADNYRATKKMVIIK